MCAVYSRPGPLAKLRRLLQHWKIPAATVAVMFSLVAAIAFLLPNQYRSQLKILVKNERFNPVVGVDQQTQGVMYVNEVSESRINTEIELLTSADVLRKVVQECHLVDERKNRGRSEAYREEVALKQLQKNLTVSAVRKSDVIEVAYQARDPRLAETVTRSLAKFYLDAHLALHGAPGSQEVFSKMDGSYSAELRDAEASLNAFRDAHHMTSLPEERALSVQEIAGLDKGIADARSTMARADHQSQELERVVAATPTQIETGRRSVPNQYSNEQLGTLLITLENKRTEATQRYRSDDRVVQELDAQIANTQKALTASREAAGQEVSIGSNPALLTAQSDFIRASTELAGSKAQAGLLEQQLRASRRRLSDLDAATAEYETLQMRVTRLRATTELLKKKEDEARINNVLDQQRLANVTIAEQPVADEIPYSPKRGLILSLGLIWSLFAGGFVAFGLDVLAETVSCPFDLEQFSPVPLLACIAEGTLLPREQDFPALYVAMQRNASLAVRSLP